MRDVLITGGTGYIGRALGSALVRRGHRVRLLVRGASRDRVVAGADAIEGNALHAESVRGAMRRGDVVVHLVGTPHPGPGKRDAFQRVDLASIRATVEASAGIDLSHLVYVSVAHPAPVMHDYIAVRAEGERLIRATGHRAVILRPWYVLGPGHRWPLALLPLYALAARIPALRDGATRLGLVTIDQMVGALVYAVECAVTSESPRVLDVPQIRAHGARPRP